jgi:hypothetical protein
VRDHQRGRTAAACRGFEVDLYGAVCPCCNRRSAGASGCHSKLVGLSASDGNVGYRQSSVAGIAHYDSLVGRCGAAGLVKCQRRGRDGDDRSASAGTWIAQVACDIGQLLRSQGPQSGVVHGAIQNGAIDQGRSIRPIAHHAILVGFVGHTGVA